MDFTVNDLLLAPYTLNIRDEIRSFYVESEFVPSFLDYRQHTKDDCGVSVLNAMCNYLYIEKHRTKMILYVA